MCEPSLCPACAGIVPKIRFMRLRSPPACAAGRVSTALSPPEFGTPEHQLSAIDMGKLDDNVEPQPRTRASFRRAGRRAWSPRRAASRQGPARHPRCRFRACRPWRPACAVTRTSAFAHLQALSMRLPAISSRSASSPRNQGAPRLRQVERDRAVGMDLLHHPRPAGSRIAPVSVRLPTTAVRAASRARSR